MPNKIQIKRTSVTGRTPNTTSSGNSSYIDAGELAINITDGKLFSSNGSVSIEIGSNLNSISVGGAKLTANATLVNAVALNVVNQTNTATLYVTTSANVGTAAVINSVGITHTGFANVTGSVNAASHTVGTTTVVNSTTIALGPLGVTNGTNITTTSIIVGNTTANATHAYNLIQAANSTSIANLTPTTLAIGSITVNSALANLQALNVVNQTNTGTLYVAGDANVGKLNVAAAGGDEGGEIYLDKPPNGTLSGGITIDSYQNRLRFFEQGGTNRGAYIDLASCGAGVATNLLASSATVAGSDTQVQFNDSTAFGASAGFTFNKTTNNVTVGNTITVGTTATVNGSLANLQALNVVNQTNTATLYVTTSANVASAFLANSTGMYHTGIARTGGATTRIILGTGMGTSEAGMFVTANSTLSVIQGEFQGSSYTPIAINPNGGAVRLAGTFGTTNGVNVTNTSIVVGNSTANATLSYNLIQASNSTSTANLTPTTLAIGSITVNSALANLQALNVVNQTNTATLYVTTSANVASAFLANSTGAYHTGTINAASHTVGTTTVVNSTAIALGPFGVTNGALITTTSLDIGNTTANAALDYNIIYVANSTARANLTPTTLAIGSITVNSALANLQALNVVNQTNTGTLFVTTSANVASAFLANSTGAYHTGTINAASHTVGTNFTSNSSQLVLNAPSYTVSFSNTNGSAVNLLTWGQSLQQAIPATTTRSLGTKIIFYDGLSGSSTDWAYGLAGNEMWASVGTTTGTFRWYAVTTAFCTSNTSFFNHNAQVRVGGGVATTNGATITNTSISVGNSTINTTANSTVILVNGVDLVATQKRAIAMSMIFGR